MTEIKQGSTIRYRKPGRAIVVTGRVEWVYIDAFTHEPYYRVRPDTLGTRRTMVYPVDIARAEKPPRKRAKR